MLRSKLYVWLFLMLAILICSTQSYAVTLDISAAGKLMGAGGIDVNGIDYVK